MSLSSREKLEVLLEQIKFPQDEIDHYFNNSLLDKVIVYKQEKRWHFFIYIEQRLPFDAFYRFKTALKQAFQHIATVELTLRTAESITRLTEEELKHYWHYFIKTL